jgi:polyphosphate kinase 2 (PPK2 family)
LRQRGLLNQKSPILRTQSAKSVPATLERSWGALHQKLNASAPTSLNELDLLLKEQGFLKKSTNTNTQLFHKGELNLEIEHFDLMNKPAYRFQLRHQRGSLLERRGIVSVDGAQIDLAYWDIMTQRAKHVQSQLKEGVLKTPEGITDALAIRRLRDSGRTPQSKLRREQAQHQVNQRLATLDSTLKEMSQKGTMPKAIVVYMEGHDGVGKASTSFALMEKLEKHGFKSSHKGFTAPPPGEKHWLDRFRQAKPKEGEVIKWDRGPAGSAAYIERSPAQLQRMQKEFRTLEQELTDQGILMIKVYLGVDNAQRALTFGKRMGYMREAKAELQHRTTKGTLTSQLEANLGEVIESFTLRDLKAFASNSSVHDQFLDFSRKSAALPGQHLTPVSAGTPN